MEIDEHHQHKDVYAHSLTVLDQAIALEKADPDAASPDLVLRLAALLHDIGKPATRQHEPRGRVSFHHHEVVGAKLVRKRLTALRYPKDVVEAVVPADLPAPALPRVRRRRVDRLRRPPLRHRRRRPAPPAAQAGAVGLHDPEQAAGGGAVGDLRLARAADRGAVGRGGPRAGCGPTSTATRSWSCSASARARGRSGLAVPQGAAARARPAGAATRPRRSCSPGGAPGPDRRPGRAGPTARRRAAVSR